MMNKKTILDFFKRNRMDFLAFFLYAIVASVIFFNFLKNISNAILPGDGIFTYWVLSWDIHSFLNHPLDIFNANIFYPNANTLAYSEGFFAPALLLLPFYLVFRNLVPVYNLAIVFSYVIAAFGAFKFAKYYTKNNYASLIAGLIFGFATFRVANGHFQNIIIFWMPFAALNLQKYFDGRKRKHLIIFALLFSGQMLTSWTMGAFFALFVAFLLVVNWRLIYADIAPIAGDMLLALVVITILVVPFAYPYFKLHQETNFSYPVWEMIDGSADIGGYVLPVPGSTESPLLSFFGIRKVHWGENMNFLGYFSMLLLTYYILFGKNKIREKNFKIFFWGIPIFILLSFGPVLRSFSAFTITLPYRVLVPFLGFIRSPNRLALIVLLCLSVSVAYILTAFRPKNRSLKFVLGAIVPAVILFEFYLPYGTFPDNTACPEIYSRVKNYTSVRAIAELPVFAGATVDKNLGYMFNSTCDGFIPIFNGYSGYYPPNFGPSSEIINDFPEKESLEELSESKISHVILHLDSYPEEKRVPLLETIRKSGQMKVEYQSGSDYLIKI